MKVAEIGRYDFGRIEKWFEQGLKGGRGVESKDERERESGRENERESEKKRER